MFSLFWIVSVALAGFLAWNLGVRRERGRQLQLNELNRVASRAGQGTRLRRIVVRR